MGILNVTPDSFSDGGQYDSYDLAVKHALSLLDQGADIIDIGGESTRPGAVEIEVKEEVRRTVPVIMALREATLGHAAPPRARLSAYPYAFPRLARRYAGRAPLWSRGERDKRLAGETPRRL